MQRARAFSPIVKNSASCHRRLQSDNLLIGLLSSALTYRQPIYRLPWFWTVVCYLVLTYKSLLCSAKFIKSNYSTLWERREQKKTGIPRDVRKDLRPRSRSFKVKWTDIRILALSIIFTNSREGNCRCLEIRSKNYVSSFPYYGRWCQRLSN